MNQQCLLDFERHNAFSWHRDEFLSRIEPINKYLPYQDVCYSPYPLVLPHQVAENLRGMSELLLKAVERVVLAYLGDVEIQSKMPIAPHFRRLLKLADGLEYKLGTMRPDMIFGRNGKIKLCEINARFPLNGMTISQWINTAIRQSSYLDWQDYRPFTRLSEIAEKMLSRFPLKQPLVRVAESELGGESIYFLDQFKLQGGTVFYAKPSQLTVSNNALMLGRQCVENLILEIDREDLLRFSSSVIEHIIERSNYINDVRTLILVHDKRILSVLADQQIMQRLLSLDDVRKLQTYLPKGLDLSENRHFDEVINNKDQWIIKKSSGGRGIDLFSGTSCSQEKWEKTLYDGRDDYMAQEYIEHMKTDIVHYRGLHAAAPMHVVGSLPCFDGHSFGVGMFRASENSCVNVGSGDGSAIFLGGVSSPGVPQDIYQVRV